MAKFNPSPVPFSSIDADMRELWVRNITKKPTNGDVFFTVPKTRGSGMDDVQVIKSWAPQNLCEQVSVAQLIDSTEFRKMLSYKNLEIISAEDAQRLINSKGEDYPEEARRIMNRRQRILEPSIGNDPVFQSAGGGSETPDSQVDMKLRSLLEPVKAGDEVNEAQLINTLRTMESDGDLKRDELKYMQKIAKAAGKKKLLRYANNCLASLDSDEDEDED